MAETDVEWFPKITLYTLRALLLSALSGKRPDTANSFLIRAANQAAVAAEHIALDLPISSGFYARSAARSAAWTARVAAYSATRSDYRSALEQAISSMRTASLIGDHTHRSQAIAADAAGAFDAAQPSEGLYKIPLWGRKAVPRTIEDTHNLFLARLESERKTWGFWHDWYLGMWEGKPLDWDLVTEVAKIPDEVWNQGAEAVAEAISEIEKARTQKIYTPRQPAFEPKSVDHIIANKTITSLKSYSVSLDVSHMFEAFRLETGLNQTPEPFLPLEALPASFLRISGILSADIHDPSSKQDLVEEVGRLNAKVAALESALKKLKNAKEPIFAPTLKKQIATSIGDWKLYAAVAAGVWMISGDDLGVQKRLENIVTLRNEIFGNDGPAPVFQPSSALPKSFDT